MVYFFIIMLLHFLVSVGILIVLLRFVKINRQRQNKRGITFLIPVLITLVFLIQTIFITAPRVLDSIYVLKNSLMNTTAQVESVAFFNNSMVMEGVRYHYNPFIYKPRIGDSIEIFYTPYAHCVIKLSTATS